ncbi:hypothetical protein R3P38DRAFT_2554207 [Favolaschia claudopus]|uniref:DNA binding HTH domain-containing protein n=1 Tax=Favolaschia claudopus TaxID=2862362 RepID=A0AAW0AEQ0_9AGAR
MAHPPRYDPPVHCLLIGQFNWPPDVLRAHVKEKEPSSDAKSSVWLHRADPIQLRAHADNVSSRMGPILVALVLEVGDQGWIELCAHALGQVGSELRRVAKIADGMQASSLRGRPKKIIEPVWLADAVSSHRKITLQALADGLGIHRNTLRNYLKLYGVYNRFSDISDRSVENPLISNLCLLEIKT